MRSGVRGCQERKGFCPLTTHKVSTTPPPRAASLPDQYRLPAFPRDRRGSRRGQRHAAGGSGGWEAPSSGPPASSELIEGHAQRPHQEPRQQAQPGAVGWTFPRRIQSIKTKTKTRVVGLNGGRIPPPHSRKGLVLPLLTTTLWGSPLCQRCFPGRFGDVGAPASVSTGSGRSQG